jgi:hypothetical protein
MLKMGSRRFHRGVCADETVRGHIHDDIPKPAFKIRQTKRATFVLSAFAAMLSALVWLLVQKLD